MLARPGPAHAATKDGVTLCNQGQEAVDVVLCGNKQTVAPGQTVRAKVIYKEAG